MSRMTRLEMVQHKVGIACETLRLCRMAWVEAQDLAGDAAERARVAEEDYSAACREYDAECANYKKRYGRKARAR